MNVGHATAAYNTQYVITVYAVRGESVYFFFIMTLTIRIHFIYPTPYNLMIMILEHVLLENGYAEEYIFIYVHHGHVQFLKLFHSILAHCRNITLLRSTLLYSAVLHITIINVSVY